MKLMWYNQTLNKNREMDLQMKNQDRTKKLN